MGWQRSDAERVRVVIVDDHELFRRGLRDILGERDVDVVGEAVDGESALAVIEQARPDVVIMDLNMPGISGIEATRRVREAVPQTRVIVLTISADGDDVVKAVLAGASGYLLKDAPINQILGGIGEVAAGGSLLSPAIATGLLDHVRSGHGPAANDPGLTDREREVLGLLAQGKDNQEIADELYISVQTVKNHVSSVLAKLQVQNRIQAAVQAVRRRLV